MASTTTYTTSGARGVWADDEHERFLEGIHRFPNGPWKAIADFVGTRTVRQVQTHAYVYHERAARRLRELRQQKTRAAVHEQSIDVEMTRICETLQRHRVPLSPSSMQLQQRSIAFFLEAGSLLDDDDDATDHATADSLSFDECLDFLIDTLSSHGSSTGSSSDSGSP